MKTLLAITCALISANLAESFQGRAESVAVIDDYIDRFLDNLEPWMVAHNYDPEELSDIHAGLSYKPLWITYHGDIDLTNGKLYQLSQLRRSGDVVIRYDNEIFFLHTPLGYKQLLYDYDYKASIMNIGPKGGINGKLEDLDFYIDIEFDLISKNITLIDFVITNAGKMTINFTGNILTDWMLNLFTGAISGPLKNTIIEKAQITIGGELEKIIAEINSILAKM